MESPVVFQPLEEELRPIRDYLKGAVLNAGCGDRDISDFLMSAGASSVENCDIQSSISGAMLCDLASVPRPDGSFDCILCNAVLEHVIDIEGVMREFYRLLRPAGHLVVSIPFLQPYHASPTDLRRFTAEGMRRLAETNGLSVVELLPLHSMAQTVSWIIWSCLQEKKSRWLSIALWGPLRLWCRASRATDPALFDNANTFQLVARKSSA